MTARGKLDSVFRDRTHRVAVSSLVANLPELAASYLMTGRRAAFIVEDNFNRYVQMLVTEEHWIKVECMSNCFRDADNLLSDEQQAHLVELGFTSPGSCDARENLEQSGNNSDHYHPNWHIATNDRRELFRSVSMMEGAINATLSVFTDNQVTLIERPIRTMEERRRAEDDETEDRSDPSHGITSAESDDPKDQS